MSNESVAKEYGLFDLIQEAREKHLWIWCHYQDLWFSPGEFEKQIKAGKFIWGRVNWELRDPAEHLKAIDGQVVGIARERHDFEQRMMNDGHG